MAEQDESQEVDIDLPLVPTTHHADTIRVEEVPVPTRRSVHLLVSEIDQLCQASDQENLGLALGGVFLGAFISAVMSAQWQWAAGCALGLLYAAGQWWIARKGRIRQRKRLLGE